MRIDRGKNLIFFLNKSIIQYEVQGKVILPPQGLATLQYKYYGKLLEQILYWQNCWGSNISQSLRLLRDGLLKEVRFSRRMEQFYQGIRFQAFVMLAIISTFFLVLLYWQIIPIPQLLMQKTIIWVLCGFILWEWGQLKLYHRLFFPFPLYFQTLYALFALLSAERPISESAQLSQLFGPHPLPTPTFLRPLYEQLLNVLEHLQQEGGSSGSWEIQGLIEELYFLQQERFELFEKWSNIGKLLLFSLFILVPYFFLLYSLFSQQLRSGML